MCQYAKTDSRFLSVTSYNDKLNMQQDLHISPETMKPLKENVKEIFLGTGMGENSLERP